MSALTINDLPTIREALRDVLSDMQYNVTAATFDHMSEIVRDMFFIEGVANAFSGNVYDYEDAPTELQDKTLKTIIADMFNATATYLRGVSANDKKLEQNKFYDKDITTTLLYVPDEFVIPSNQANISNCFRNCINLLSTPYNVEPNKDLTQVVGGVETDKTAAVTRRDYNSTLASQTERTYMRPYKYDAANYHDVPTANKTTAVTNMAYMFQDCKHLQGTLRVDCTAATTIQYVAVGTSINTLIIDNLRSDIQPNVGQIGTNFKGEQILGLKITQQIGYMQLNAVLIQQKYIKHIEFTTDSLLKFEARKSTNTTYNYGLILSITSQNLSFDADTLLQFVEMLYDWQNDPDDQGGTVGYTHANKTLKDRCQYYDLAANRKNYDSRNTSVDDTRYSTTNYNASAFTDLVCAKGLCLYIKQRNLQTLADTPAPSNTFSTTYSCANALDYAYALACVKGWRLISDNMLIGTKTYQGCNNRTLYGDSRDFEIPE